MSQNQRPDPYASEAESAALLVPDTRTPAERTLDTLLDDAGYGEQGAEPVLVLRRVALKLVEQFLQPVAWQCRSVGSNDFWQDCTRDRAAARASQPLKWQVRALCVAPHPAEIHGITKGST